MVGPKKEPRGPVETLRRRIPVRQLSFRFARSRGPGGQNVNKVSTRVSLHFDLAGSDALTDSEKRRIRTRMPGRVSKEGYLRVVSMRHRTQGANRNAAIDRFYELLAQALSRPKPRKPTRVPQAAHQRRLSDKRLRSRRKRQRSARSVDDAEM
ncbi:MAG: aminoacyl-tRNA hydrolase [Phycisphaerales bacterium]|nr:MAG: aminoacyl-tRNA hydrolase [Phycisphaerales bacterium]